MNDFVGRGWAFPPQVSGRGGVVLSGGDSKISQSIWIILSTPVGQRVMRPTFGSRLHELVFADANAETMGLAEMYVEEALRLWEPRIEVLEVDASISPESRHVLLLNIQYRIKATHDERSLVYPFYRIPGEPGGL
ncbi:MAG: GPW/gp25 family protein [Anaerolineae bacterium]